MLKKDKYCRRVHKRLKKLGKYACDGCYVCAGQKLARFSKREATILSERIEIHEA